MSASFIKIENLHKSFNGQLVLDGIDLTIERGESIVVIGQSGCDKSVLLKHLIRLLDPDDGHVYFDGDDIAEMKPLALVHLRRRFGMLFQSAALFDSMTVAENVGLGLCEARQLDDEQIESTIHQKLEMVGLGGASAKEADELSGGMRKRVGLARAIAGDPEVLLYDEPTTGLDPITADMIDELIVNLNTKLKVTSITVTHDMKSAFKIAGRIIMLYNGKIEFDGSPDEIRSSSNAVVQQFITGSATGPINV